MTSSLEYLLRYDVWANRETWRSLLPEPAPSRSLRWMNHIVGAELLWLARMDGTAAPLPVWPDLSVAQCGKRVDQLAAGLPDAMPSKPEGLSRPVSYTNSKGEPWTSTVGEILTHLVIHSAYHRGQIASDLRAAGREPAYTDYIHAVRQGRLE